MEDLLSCIEKSCLITNENEHLSKRRSQFKFGNRTEDLARERRRAQLLEDYKRKRDALVDEKRGLLNDEFVENDDWMDWQESKKRQTKGRKWINPHCKNQLMLSEWLLDHPSDLDTNWTVVLCPEGRRTLVIAKKGCTRAYHKNGFLLAKFKSILPNGASSNRCRNADLIILDCIWNESSKRLFALDVLYWKNQTLLNCDAQFRLYWLKSKLSEVKQGLSEECTEPDVYDVFLPAHCVLSTLSSTLAEHDPKEVDGLLFYHNGAPYVSGQTPLVGWLKPFMLPERFGVTVPSGYLDLRPENYTTLEQWVEQVSHSHSRNPTKKQQSKMEMDSTSTQESDTSEVLTSEMEENLDN